MLSNIRNEQELQEEEKEKEEDEEVEKYNNYVYTQYIHNQISWYPTIIYNALHIEQMFVSARYNTRTNFN